MSGVRDWTGGVPTLLTSICGECGHRWYLQRARCPRCSSPDVSRRVSARSGTTLAVTTAPSAASSSAGAAFPHIALVDLDDGIRIMARCAEPTAPGLRVSWFFPVPAQDGHADSTGPLVPHVQAVDR